MRKFPMIAAVLSAGLLLAACGGGDDGSGVRTIGDGSSGSATGSASGSAGASGSGEARCEPVGDLAEATARVNVSLDEWAIDAGEGAVPAGDVGFVVENVGEEPHELVVIEGVGPTELPTDDDGALIEDDLPDGALVGEVEAFPAGETCDGVFALDPGEYTLVCNLTEVEDGEVESHLAEGMVTTLTVS